ncbi:hypothetical protein CONLIGDRAFT_677075 [Coniochaeta ligniaria NRRL 30616]|uniref:Uncharacterized protein n=1 Tax=Coniochaeta ligniaria NRRL 30616 TaxID=1408157 RepID=A0A1J7J1A4_9PEZI|nr:hypothetical protein CONLIGDRAFT_677075 [Coniochaeta ligniaria NRRL 30616]
MCCIPCFPYSEVDFEEEPRAQKRAGEAYQYVWNGQNWVLQPCNGRRRRSGARPAPCATWKLLQSRSHETVRLK